MDFINLKSFPKVLRQKLLPGLLCERLQSENTGVSFSTGCFLQLMKLFYPIGGRAALPSGATAGQSTATKAPAEDRGTQSEFMPDVLFPSGGPGRRKRRKYRSGKKIVKYLTIPPFPQRRFSKGRAQWMKKPLMPRHNLATLQYFIKDEDPIFLPERKQWLARLVLSLIYLRLI